MPVAGGEHHRQALGLEEQWLVFLGLISRETKE